VVQGATFWIELAEAPQSGEPASAGEIERASSRPPGRGTVLYIEDNQSNIRLLERLLSHRPGISLLTATTGMEGFAHAVRDSPDLILLDLHLPDLSGDAVLERLARDSRTRDIPVIILSADVTSRHADQVLEAGARAYLTKPLALTELLATIDEHLSSGHDPNQDR
jgi:CheY-like chemotaxis protein